MNDEGMHNVGIQHEGMHGIQHEGMHEGMHGEGMHDEGMHMARGCMTRHS